MGTISRFLKRERRTREDSQDPPGVAASTQQQGTDGSATSTPSPSQYPPSPLPTTSGAGPRFPDGVEVWVENLDATIDVCFVHGLTGDRDTTWIAPGQSVPWPKMFLADKLPGARLLTYGYDAYVVKKSVASTNTLTDHATNLLMDLTTDRASNDAASRRIIFVAHSLGGLVCKEAILQSRNNPERHLRDLFENVVGVIFMGTPHEGSWMADWAKLPAHALGLFKSTNKSLLQVLQTNNQLLQSIQRNFLHMVRELREDSRRFEITCFFEELPLEGVGRVVVTKASATFDGYSGISIHENHSDMVKFQSAEDTGFRRVLGELKRWERDHRSTSVIGRAERERILVARLREECLRSLSFPQMDDRFHDIDDATEGTCQWLLSHRNYTNWDDRDRGLLWIKGKPGSGKSTLLRYALNNASTNLGDAPLILSFFFHDRGVELQKTPQGLFRSLLHQLLRHAPDALSDLVTLYQNKCQNMGEVDTKWQWHLRELQDTFKSSIMDISKHRPVWLFVDALDECGKKNATSLVKEFEALVQGPPSNTRFHICFTCRHYPILALDHGLEICLEHENGNDIFTYLHDKLGITKTRIPEKIIKRITQRASGVFIWTRLVIERILDLEREGMGWEEIEAEVNVIPDELDDLYQALVRDMKKNPASLKLIQWICFAKKPISLDALQWAMAIDIKCPHQSLQEYRTAIVDRDLMKRRIQTLSCGLVEITVTDDDRIDHLGVVQFVHQTVKDFFLEKGLLALDSVSKSIDIAIANAHYQLSRICIHYLTMQEITRVEGRDIIFHDGGFPGDNFNNVQLTSKFPLAHYATTNWMLHESKSEEIDVTPDDLPETIAWRSNGLPSWGHIYELTDPSSREVLSPEVCVVHLASRFSLIRPLRRILRAVDQNVFIINFKTPNGSTPLMMAARNGHADAVRLLLEIGKAEADLQGRFGQTPLSHAAERGYQDIVQLLLNIGKVKADLPDKIG
ncbi:hypothetical protein NUW58_g7879 [Xylaria curta]|uniref:Uncharacterized protein n=1 Tax=Xylaria curta TaxID=42375 RepID=A0ACC1ND22_9PEZI|nr:hypothetical protein NUW58_g7879 [Xylaria curta]